jgi:hypothetical protein
LNEEVQLTSEVSGLALLLEGALSDQTVQWPHGADVITLPKRRVTIGIPVSIVPSDEDKDAVAEVIVTVTPTVGGMFHEAPAITAILPQDKTYNVATITGKSFNAGGGVVTGVMTAGVNFLWQKQTYYIVQAQDTVAFQLPAAAPETIRFGWQLRPVLGARTVSSGMRTLFVQLAFPPPIDEHGVVHEYQDYGTLTVTTGWKKVDRKLNTVATDYTGAHVGSPEIPIHSLNLQPQIAEVYPLDNGDGTVTVHLVSTSYLQNTYIKIAGITIGQGATNILLTPTSIDFTAPASLLATQRAYIVDRSGASQEIVSPLIGAVADFECIHNTGNPIVVPENATMGRLTLGVARVPGLYCPDVDGGPTLSGLHLIAMVGSKVFGLRDAPITVDDAHNTISFRAPMELLRGAPTVVVEKLLWGTPYRLSADLTVTAVPGIDKATVIAKGKDNLQIALMGSNLQRLTPPAGMHFNADGPTCTPSDSASDHSNTGRILCVPQKLAAKFTEVALNSDSGDLLLVELPAKPKATATPTGPTLEPQGSIDEGVATTLTVKGNKLDGFDHVEIGTTKISAEGSADKIVVHLPADLVKAPKVVLVFIFKGSKKISYTVTVNKKTAAGTKP